MSSKHTLCATTTATDAAPGSNWLSWTAFQSFITEHTQSLVLSYQSRLSPPTSVRLAALLGITGTAVGGVFGAMAGVGLAECIARIEGARPPLGLTPEEIHHLKALVAACLEPTPPSEKAADTSGN